MPKILSFSLNSCLFGTDVLRVLLAQNRINFIDHFDPFSSFPFPFPPPFMKTSKPLGVSM